MGGGVTCTAGTATSCPAECFACTVTADSGKSCSVSTTTVECTHNGSSIMPSAQDGSFMCINIGMENLPANGASLGWSVVPNCSAAEPSPAAAPAAAPSSTDASGAHQAAVPAAFAMIFAMFATF